MHESHLPKRDLRCLQPRCANKAWKDGLCLSPSARHRSWICRCARARKDGSSMVAESKLGQLGVEEREGTNQQSQELLLSVSASNDSWWHHGLVLSWKGNDSRSAVGMTWACFHTGCLENNWISTLPSSCQQSPTDMRGGLHLKEWFEGKWLEGVFQTFVPHMEDRTQEKVRISLWYKDKCVVQASITTRAKVTFS